MKLNLWRADGERPWLVGHRGACAVAPENTMASFQRAWEEGADVVELDVRRSADGHVVVIHDATVDRTTDGHGPVAELTLQELKRLDAGRWFDPAFVGESIPTLAEVLAWARGRIGLLLELKYDHGAFDSELAPAVAALLRRHGVVEQTACISYSARGLLQIKESLPGLPTGPIVRGGRLARWLARLSHRIPGLTRLPALRRLLLHPLTFVQAMGGDFVAPSTAMLTPLLVRASHAAGFPVSPGGRRWDYPAAIAMGVDTISSNDPGAVRRAYLTE